MLNSLFIPQYNTRDENLNTVQKSTDLFSYWSSYMGTNPKFNYFQIITYTVLFNPRQWKSWITESIVKFW